MKINIEIGGKRKKYSRKQVKNKEKFGKTSNKTKRQNIKKIEKKTQ